MFGLNSIKAINKIMYFTTIGLYLTLYLGMMFQIVLGFCQIVTAIYVTIKYYKRLSINNQKGLKIYWTAAISTLIADAFSIHSPDLIAGIILFVIPMAIATYFLILLSSITTEINE